MTKFSGGFATACGRFTSRFQESMTSELRLGNEQFNQGHKLKISLCNTTTKQKIIKRFIIQYAHFITRFFLNIHPIYY